MKIPYDRQGMQVSTDSLTFGHSFLE